MTKTKKAVTNGRITSNQGNVAKQEKRNGKDRLFNRNTLIGALAGFTIGASVALLLAPQKGSDLRKKIADTGEDMMDDLNNRMDALKEKYDALRTNMSESGREAINNLSAESRHHKHG